MAIAAGRRKSSPAGRSSCLYRQRRPGSFQAVNGGICGACSASCSGERVATGSIGCSASRGGALLTRTGASAGVPAHGKIQLQSSPPMPTPVACRGSYTRGRGATKGGPAVAVGCVTRYPGRMSYWLVKSEPDVYAFERLVREGRTTWDGVRNAQARNYLARMKVGERALYYHSNEGKAVVGVAEVRKEAFPDPSADDPKWLAVELGPVKALPKPVTLAQFKEDPLLRETLLVRQGRLSVLELTEEQYRRVLELGGEGA